MTRELKLASFDGVKLYAKIDTQKDSKAVVVIVHGLCEHLGRYDYITAKLLGRNFSVYRFDHRGHGKSEGDRVFYSNYNELIDDVNVIVDMAKSENPGLPVFLIGHSMGGYGVACYGTKYPGKVNGIVISGGLTRDNKGLISQLPKGLDPKGYTPNELAGGVCSDEEVVKAYIADPLVEKQISFGLFYAIADGVKWLKENHAAFVEPVLMLHGCNDGLVCEKDLRDFFGDISSTDKGLKIYPKLFHEISNEPCKDKVIGDAIEWLEAHI
jgi:lysophospholipase